MVKIPDIAKRILFVLTFCSVPLVTAHADAQPLVLEGPSATVREGYFTVSASWQNDQQQPLSGLVIEVSTQRNFTEVEQRFPALGNFTQLSLTGFSDGVYYLRARSDASEEPSNIINVKVQHYPLWQALGLFSSGLVIFLLLAVTLVRSHYRVEKEAGDD